jgi:hypothetical protein
MPLDRTPLNSKAVSAWCVVAAFGAYFCMYGFRKPFTVAEFAATPAWGLAFKPVAVIAQVLGYTAAKFLGIKAIAELDPKRRVAMLLALIAAAEAALAGFALTPAPWNVAWLFLNGLSLGMVFGLVLGFLEGRRQTEALAAALCTSFIVADGVTKSVGAELLARGVGEFWMPAAAGLLFTAPLLVFAWMLSRIPPPTPLDVAARSERAPMNRADRRAFFRRYGAGLSLIVAMYLLVTILRSVRSDFAPEIWKGLGVEVRPGVYAWLEIAVALGVLALNGSAVFIANNRQAFFFALALAAVGAVIVLAASAGSALGLSPYFYMFLQGLGLYLPYIAVHTTIFERLIAMTRDRGNIGYLMYLADAIGYLGYVVVLLVRTWVQPTSDFLPFYDRMSVGLAALCIAMIIPCWRYFAAHATLHATSSAPAPAGAS